MDIFIFLLTVPVALMSLYLFILTLASFSTKFSKNTRQHRTIAIVVPAHNEELLIERTVQSAFSANYPRAYFDVFVVADNCTDNTAVLAKKAGAFVLKRDELTRRGKGYALKFAFDWILSNVSFDAIVVIDADTLMAPESLLEFNRIFNQGEHVIQASYGVSNVKESWRTRMMTVAFSVFHDVRSRGREALRLSSGLRGNGMAFTTDVLKQVPYGSYSLTEDVEYGVILAQQGYRVCFAENAKVFGEMPATAEASKSQRLRWELGRMQLLKQFLTPLIKNFISKKNWVFFDLAMDLIVLPLSYLVSLNLFIILISAVSFSYGGSFWPLLVSLTSLAMISTYVLRGVFISPLGIKGLEVFLFSPFYIAWKMTLALKNLGQMNTEWIRTTRSKESI